MVLSANVMVTCVLLLPEPDSGVAAVTAGSVGASVTTDSVAAG
jgi:hypothetical protein